MSQSDIGRDKDKDDADEKWSPKEVSTEANIEPFEGQAKSSRHLGSTSSGRFVRKDFLEDPQTSRLRLGDEMELRRHYDIHRNKYDEMILLSRATNSIIAVFTSAYASLKANNDWFNAPVAMCLDTPVTQPTAWTGLIAEALRFISKESKVVQSSPLPILNKKQILARARNVLTSTVKEALDSIQRLEKLVEKLNSVLQDCTRSITSMITGIRSRFYQSIWQTDLLLQEQGRGGEGESLGEMKSLLDPISSSVSSSSLLSIHLLTPYVRWDVDGISIKKQVSKSWPLIKFSYLSFPRKLDFLTELFAGFLSFLQIPTQNIQNSLSALEETSRTRGGPSKGEVTVLDHQFRTILNVLLSERYFHPSEQRKGLVFGLKIQENFQRLKTELEKVQRGCRELSESWKRVFKNGDITLSNASSVVTSTNVPQWKSCKDFSFQLDLSLERDLKIQSCSPLPELKHPKNFPRALQEHFEVLEDFEESYQNRLKELKERAELLIVENDIRPCTDLAQQLFFHFEHIGTSLHAYTGQLMESRENLLSPIPTDPPTSPGIYRNYSPSRQSQAEENIPLVSLTGWLGAVLELLGSLNSSPDFPLAEDLKGKCLQLSQSVFDLATLLQTCVTYHKKAEKSMERIVSSVEKYFNILEDDLKILSRVASTEEIPVVANEAEGLEESILKEISSNQDGEVSIFVTVNGVYFNQFGVMFSLRLDVTTIQHRLQIIELFIRQVSLQIEGATNLVKNILAKFGRRSLSNGWWKRLLKSSQPAMLIEGGLEEEVYNQTIFHLLGNVETAFSQTNVKASLEIYSELEALVLIRSTRILEDEVVRFGRACQAFSQGLAQLEPFRKYFRKSCLEIFRNNPKVPCVFDKWHKLSCFKLLMKDEDFKNQLDQVLTSTGSENVSRASSDHQLAGKGSSLHAGGAAAGFDHLAEIDRLWGSLEEILGDLREANAVVPEGDPTVSKAISLSSGFMDRKYICTAEATSILIANGVTHLHLEAFPKRYKLLLLKKIKSVCSKLSECSSIITHSETMCGRKAAKVNARVKDILERYSHVEFQDSKFEKASENSLAGVSGVKDLEGSPCQNDAQVANSIDASDMDIFVSLDFPFESLKLSYRGYERSASFRALMTQPEEQAKVLDCMLESICDRLTTIVEVARKTSLVYIQINRNVKKLSQKIDQSLPLHQLTLTELLTGVWKVLENVEAQIALNALRDTFKVLQTVKEHLTLAVAFLKKHEDLSQEPNVSPNDFTLTVRNPFEKDIRELFTTPIRIVLPYSQFELKI